MTRPSRRCLPERRGVYPDPSRLTALADAVRKAAPAPVRRVLVDTSRYSGPTHAADLGPGGRRRAGSSTPIEPLMLDGGRKDPDAGGRGARRRPGAHRRPGAGRAAGRGCRQRRRGAPPRRTPPCSAPSPPRRSRTSSSTRSVRRTTCSPRCWPARSRSSARPSPSFDGAAAQTLVALSQAGFDTAGAQLVDGSGLSTDGPGARAAARRGARPGGGPGPGSARHPVPPADRHRPAGRGRRRHPGRPVRAPAPRRPRAAGWCGRRPAR